MTKAGRPKGAKNKYQPERGTAKGRAYCDGCKRRVQKRHLSPIQLLRSLELYVCTRCSAEFNQRWVL